MKAAVIGLTVGASLLVAGAWAVGAPGFSQGQAVTVPAHGGELISLATPVGDNRQQLTVIDPKMRVVSVYHIELATGEITLKSVRNISWDLQMSEFNGVNPLPRDIRTLVETR